MPEPSPDAAARRRLAGIRLVTVYLAIMAATLAASAGIVIALGPITPADPCPPLPAPCSRPPTAPQPIKVNHAVVTRREDIGVVRSDAAATPDCESTTGSLGTELIIGQALTLTDVGVTLVWDDCTYNVLQADGSQAVLEIPYLNFRRAIVDVRASSASQSPTVAFLFLKASTENLNALAATDDQLQIKAPSIGYEHAGGVAETDIGQDVDDQGQPIGNAVWTYVAATNGHATLAVRVTEAPGSVGFTRSRVQKLLQDVHWSTP